MEQARENRLEAASRDELLENTESAWKELLSRILVEGGEELERTLFYTALYNCFRIPHGLMRRGGTEAWTASYMNLPRGVILPTFHSGTRIELCIRSGL